MANTEDIEAKLAAYVDGELDASDRAEIEQHLKTNPQHRRIIEELRSVRVELQALPRVSAPMDIVETLGGQLERAALLGDVQMGGAHATHFSGWPQFRAVAAILLLTAGLAAVLYYVLPSPRAQSDHVAVVTSEHAPTGSTTRLEEPKTGEPTTGDVRSDSFAAGGVDARAAAPRNPGGTLPGSSESSSRGVLPSAITTRDPTDATDRARAADLGASNTAYLYIDTTDPVAANTQVRTYLNDNNISFRQLGADEDDVRKPGNAFGGEAKSLPTTQPEIADSALAQSSMSNARELQPLAGAGGPPSTQPIVPPGAQRIVAKMSRREAEVLNNDLTRFQPAQTAQMIWPGEPQAPGDLALEKQKQEGAATMPSLESMRAASEPLKIGDRVRVRGINAHQADLEAVNEVVIVNADGNIELPGVGILKAAGLAPSEIATTRIPEISQRTQMNQAPVVELRWIVEKLPEPAVADQTPPPPAMPPGPAGADNSPAQPSTAPTPAEKSADADATLRRSAGNAMTASPTTSPTGSDQDERVEVLIVVRPQAVAPTTAPTETELHLKPAPTTAPTTSPSTQPVSTQPIK